MNLRQRSVRFPWMTAATASSFYQRHVPFISFLLIYSLLYAGCETSQAPDTTPPVCNESLTLAEVQQLVRQAVEIAERVQRNVTVAVTDREGNTLAVFEMTGTSGDSVVSITKARTAAYLSSNQHAFSTLTACFITRSHFPPGVSNTPAGPLFGVGFSNLPDGDIQPNGSKLNDRPGGIPVYKSGCLVGGVGISGAGEGFDAVTCSGVTQDEVIALGAVIGFSVPDEKRGDNIFIDGIRFLLTNASVPVGNFDSGFDLSSRGTFTVAAQAAPSKRFPDEGVVLLGVVGGIPYDFPITAGSILTAADVDRIIRQAAAQAARTRAAIRRPLGSPAQVFISVVDTDGTVLGIWRTPEATLFSYDVSAQKARTVVAYSRADHPLGSRLRTVLGLAPTNEIAITTRAIGFLSQDFFPPGIDRTTLGDPVIPGPLFQGPNFQLQDSLGLNPFGNGITIFPGGIPLYKNGVLAGGIGISGDGVDQDDLIAFAGSQGFEPPPGIRCDRFFFDEVRLPYIKTPRQPEL
ncbi:MAG: GlcG/HbpS family heme-binding protein [Bacteroidota bacterium]